MIRLSRELRTMLASHSAPVGKNAWAGSPVATELAPFVITRVIVSGEPDPTTGYLCDIKVLDDWMREQVLPVLRQSVASAQPSLFLSHAVLQAAGQLAGAAPKGTTWESLEVRVSPYLCWSTTKEILPMVRLTEQFEFSAAHRLHCRSLSEDENRGIFGKCNNPNGHGHNYFVDVTIEGTPDASTGLLMPPGRFEEIVQHEVISLLDHKHLNQDTSQFADLNPSVENIALVIWKRLDGLLAPARLANVRVYETAKTWVDYSEA